jgi:hypothetical protein
VLIEKSRSGVYQNTSENRRLNRVGQHYGEAKKPEEKKGGDNVKDVEIVTSKAGIKTFLSGRVGDDYYRAVAEVHKALRRSGKSKSVDLMLKESGSGSPSKDIPAKKYVEAVNNGATHDEAVAFADDCYKEFLAKIQNVQQKVHNEGVSTSAATKMFMAVNKWFNAQKFEKKAVLEAGVEEVPSKVEKQPVKESVEKQDKPTSRVTFADVPRSKEVNLKKYLTDSRRKQVDYLMKAAEVMPKSTVKQMHDAAVKKFNDNFDSLKKSERASALYVIMKYKDLLNKVKSLDEKNVVSKDEIEVNKKPSALIADTLQKIKHFVGYGHLGDEKVQSIKELLEENEKIVRNVMRAKFPSASSGSSSHPNTNKIDIDGQNFTFGAYYTIDTTFRNPSLRGNKINHYFVKNGSGKTIASRTSSGLFSTSVGAKNFCKIDVLRILLKF